ncbi:hypothetical protein BLOT_010119 [Blomia tropicalis]|nr:hypothetical protein BLOT_010119 [Blomia tropicalis]
MSSKSKFFSNQKFPIFRFKSNGKVDLSFKLRKKNGEKIPFLVFKFFYLSCSASFRLIDSIYLYVFKYFRSLLSLYSNFINYIISKCVSHS